MSLRHLSMSQLAEITGLDRRTVKDRLKDVEPFGTHGKAILFDTVRVLPILLGVEQASDSDLQRQLLEEQLRFEKARAEKMNIEIEKMKRELVPTEEVNRIYSAECAAVRARILSIPARCSVDLAPETTPSLVNERLTQECVEALAELTADSIFNENSEHVEQLSNTTEKDTSENPETAPKTKSSRMG